MTAVDRLAWELRIREGVPLKLCGTIPSGTTVFGIEGTNTELRAALYKALALLGDDGSQGRFCPFCSSGVPGSHTAACARPR